MHQLLSGHRPPPERCRPAEEIHSIRCGNRQSSWYLCVVWTLWIKYLLLCTLAPSA